MTVCQSKALGKKVLPGTSKALRTPFQQKKKSNTKREKKGASSSSSSNSSSTLGKFRILFQRAAFHARPCISGRWKRDDSLSDDLAPLCKLASLGWLARKRQKSLQYLEIEDTPTHFRRSMTGRLLHISDTFSVGAQPETVPHRWDQRRGKMKGMVEQTPSGPRTWVKWGDPHGLEIWELYSIAGDEQSLTVYTSAVSRDSLEEVLVKTVYTKMDT